MNKIMYCDYCKENREVIKSKIEEEKVFKDKKYSFRLTHFICLTCLNKINSQEILNFNNKEIDEQYRYYENIVTVHQIEQCMHLYNLGKAPFSLALGLGEITITRYCQGQFPSKQYSDLILNVLHDYNYMEELLNLNKSKIGVKAYEKALEKINEYKKIFNQDKKILGVLSILFRELINVDEYTIYILLYYIQGIYSSIFNKTIFSLDCCADNTGIIFVEICDLIHKLNDVSILNFLSTYENDLNKYEKFITKLVCETFGSYSYKFLKNLIQLEYPYIKARSDYYDFESGLEIMDLEVIKAYFIEINDKYNIDTVEGINNYIEALICNEKKKDE